MVATSLSYRSRRPEKARFFSNPLLNSPQFFFSSTYLLLMDLPLSTTFPGVAGFPESPFYKRSVDPLLSIYSLYLLRPFPPPFQCACYSSPPLLPDKCCAFLSTAFDGSFHFQADTKSSVGPFVVFAFSGGTRLPTPPGHVGGPALPHSPVLGKERLWSRNFNTLTKLPKRRSLGTSFFPCSFHGPGVVSLTHLCFSPPSYRYFSSFGFFPCLDPHPTLLSRPHSTFPSPY